jgi:hypothetical protein
MSFKFQPDFWTPIEGGEVSAPFDDPGEDLGVLFRRVLDLMDREAEFWDEGRRVCRERGVEPTTGFLNQLALTSFKLWKN